MEMFLATWEYKIAKVEKKSWGNVWRCAEKRKMYCVNWKTLESLSQGKEGLANLLSLFLQYF